jgi:peptidoglycan/xylan/chitin deacetylase (PgdA/CDA1 family)
LDTLTRLSTPARADFSGDLEAGKRFSVITFDDGAESLLTEALPELAKREIPFTVFLVAGAMGEVPPWEAPDPISGERERLMTQEEVLRLPSHLVTFGAHTLRHPNLLLLSEADARREIEGSRVLLERMLERPVKLFSFPFGAHDSRLVEYCREGGYARAFTTMPSHAFENANEFVTGRVPVEPSDWPLEFRLKLLGGYNWLPAAIAVKRRLKMSSPRRQPYSDGFKEA